MDLLLTLKDVRVKPEVVCPTESRGRFSVAFSPCSQRFGIATLTLTSILTSNLILGLCLVGPFLLFMALVSLRDHRLYIAAYFRDEGCDETREARGWKREKQLEIMGLWLGMSVALILFLFVRGD